MLPLEVGQLSLSTTQANKQSRLPPSSSVSRQKEAPQNPHVKLTNSRARQGTG